MKISSITATFSILLFSTQLLSQTSRTEAPDIEIEMSGLEEPIVSEEYVLMPGDSLLITITGATNYSYMTGVTYEGKVTVNIPVTSIPTTQGIYLPQYDVVEAVELYGLTMENAKDSLRSVFSKYFRNIDADITLLGMRRFTVFLVGEVKKPGKVQAWPVDRVSAVIERAGGLTTIGSRSRIEIRRDGAVYQTVNLEEFERTGNKEVNPFVHDGDLIYVPRMAKSVIVMGAVFGKREFELLQAELIVTEPGATPERERMSEGLYELIEGETVLDIIDKAGGVTPWTDLKNVYIERDGHKIMVNLAEVLADENSGYNILMADGDKLYVPSVPIVVYVQGQVVNPGSFDFLPNLRASDYIGLAGGPLAEASMGTAYIQRGKKRLPVNDDPVIEQGDRIVVPRVIFKFWQDYVEITAVFASLLISYLTLVK